MAFGMAEGISIRGITCALPDNCVKTIEHTKQFDIETLERIVEQTGVEQTYRTKKEQTISDLCCSASEKLIESLGWDKNSIGGIVLTTHAFDYRRPSTTSVLQKRLGLGMECFTLDINLGCSGFVYGMMVLSSLMTAMDIDRAILMCGDLSSKAVKEDNTSNLLFGDVGAAIALEKNKNAKTMHFMLNADGNRYKSIFMRSGGFRHPDTENTYVEMEGVDVFAFSATEIPQTIIEFMKKTSLEKESFDMFALHQANKSIVNRIIKKCKFDKEKTPIVLNKYGNTNSSSIPLTIADTIRGAEKQTERHILIAGFGIGLSWGVGDIYIPEDAKIEIISTDSWYDDELEETKTCS